MISKNISIAINNSWLRCVTSPVTIFNIDAAIANLENRVISNNFNSTDSTTSNLKGITEFFYDFVSESLKCIITVTRSIFKGYVITITKIYYIITIIASDYKVI